jgi:hypothetical protein
MPVKHIATVDGSVDVELTQAELDKQVLDAQKAAARKAIKDAEEARVGTLSGDAQVQAWITRLAGSSNEQIDTFFANNVTNAAQAIGVLKAVVKILAYKLK